MAEITPQNVAKLREMTGVGMMECKKALVEAQGNIETAVDILRKSGAASAAKKATREAREGVIAQAIAAGGKSGWSREALSAVAQKLARELLSGVQLGR